MRNAQWKYQLKCTCWILVSTLITTIFLFGCASGPILLDFRYNEPPKGAVKSWKAIVGVSPFKDQRGKAASVIGKRFADLNNQTIDLVVQGTVSDKVTEALIKALISRRIWEKDLPGWDLTEARIPADEANVAISGEIKKLWVDTSSSLAKTTIKANVELRIVAADIQKKKIFRTLNVNSAVERQTVTFSRGFVENALSEAITSAINQIFDDDELKSKLVK